MPSAPCVKASMISPRSFSSLTFNDWTLLATNSCKSEDLAAIEMEGNEARASWISPSFRLTMSDRTDPAFPSCSDERTRTSSVRSIPGADPHSSSPSTTMVAAAKFFDRLCNKLPSCFAVGRDGGLPLGWCAL